MTPATDLRRALLQKLSDLERAGLTHVPQEWLVATDRAVSADETAGESSAAASVSSPPLAESSQPAVQHSASAPLFSEMNEPPMKSPAPRQPARCTLSHDERVIKLRAVAGTVSACTRCQELAATRTKTVFGVGNPEAELLFIGEAPGADEDRVGEPFVGRAGQLLDRIIAACGFRREDVYICNILKCRPPGNRNPSDEEAANCREYLDAQLATVDPDFIVCWGSIAAKNLLGTQSPIGRLRGKFYQHGRAKVLCTYHPSYLLRNPAAKKDVWEDMKILLNEMGRPVPA